GADGERLPPADRARDPRVVVLLRSRRAPPQRLGAEEEQAVEREEDARVLRRGEELAEVVLQRQSEDPGRDRADDEQPAELRVAVGADLTVAQRTAEPLDDPDPVAPEEAEQHER